MSTSEFTKYMIAKGVKQLLETKDFEQISVGDIARQCKISRNTFYYHLKIKRSKSRRIPVILFAG